MRALAIGLLLTAFALTGCGSAKNYYLLEEWGEGWTLEVKEEADRFSARWIPGEHRSARLTNYDDSHSNVVLHNTLFLELDDKGVVVNGRLKRVVMSRFDRTTYEESAAQWFRVLEGSCILDEEGAGDLDVACQGGYRFVGKVSPSDELEFITPDER